MYQYYAVANEERRVYVCKEMEKRGALEILNFKLNSRVQTHIFVLFPSINSILSTTILLLSKHSKHK